VPSTLRDPFRPQPNWGLDGGNGAVASVFGMDDNDFQVKWEALYGIMRVLGGYSMDCSQVVELMEVLNPEN